jgi:hypothetical protein
MATSPGRRAGKRKRGRSPEASSLTQKAACGVCLVNALAASIVPVQTPQLPPGPASFLAAAALSSLVLWFKMHGAPGHG